MRGSPSLKWIANGLARTLAARRPEAILAAGDAGAVPDRSQRVTAKGRSDGSHPSRQPFPPGVDDGHVEPFEVFGVPGRDRGATRECDARNQRIAEIDCTSGLLPVGSELRRRRRGHRIEVEHAIGEVVCVGLGADSMVMQSRSCVIF